MMLVSFVLKGFIFGGMDAVVNKCVYFNDQDEVSFYLRIIVRDEGNKEKQKNQFDGDGG